MRLPSRSAFAAILLLPLLSAADVPPTRQPVLRAGDARRAALDKALAFLGAKANKGALSREMISWYRLTPYSAAGLSMLACDNGWDCGPYAPSLRHALEHIRDHRFDEVKTGGYWMGTWGHAYSVLFLAELSRTAAPAERSEIDRLAVQLIAELSSWQSKTSGGWGHNPELKAYMPDKKGSDYKEFAVITSLCLTSLLRAREAGFQVDPAVIAGGFKYLDAVVQKSGAPQYAAGDKSGVGDVKEGAPRGAMVMWSYASDKRDNPDLRALIGYLKGCQDFSGGHALAVLGLAHSALMFSQIREFDFLWKLHGQSILDRQRPDGSFNPLPPGARMGNKSDDDDDITQSFFALTLAAPDMPWLLPAPLPANAQHPASLVRNAVRLGAKNPDVHLTALAALRTDADGRKISAETGKIFEAWAKDQKPAKVWPEWMGELVGAYVRAELVPGAAKSIAVSLAPAPVQGLKVKLTLTGTGGKSLGETSLSAKDGAWSSGKLVMPAGVEAKDLTLVGSWAWRGLSFETRMPVLMAEVKK